jgi:hypothetical protein
MKNVGLIVILTLDLPGCTVLQAEKSLDQFLIVSLEFLIDIILLAALWPWVNLASNRNEYQE